MHVFAESSNTSPARRGRTITVSVETGLKNDVRAFWQASACGEALLEGADLRAQFDAQAKARCDLEPHIHPFARFHEGHGRDVLEIGVGLGADHVEWARSEPRRLCGVDITDRAIEFTKRRLEIFGLASELQTADAEALPFPNESFDLVYSYGVLHHTPDTARAINEVWRVLRPGGTARVMIYHSPSMVGLMLWARYGLLAGTPLRTLRDIYAKHLESPGTQAFSVREAREMFSRFTTVSLRTQLGHGDLLQGPVGQRHRGPLLSLACAIWPRPLIKRFLPGLGTGLMIEAQK